MDDRNSIAPLASAKRILVLGSSGSGKTTFSMRLADVLGISLIHLDAHFWQAGWIPTPRTQWRTVVSSLIERESWIMDGTYESTLDLRIPAADAIIVIDRWRLGCLWRVVKRAYTIDDLTRPDAPPGQKLDRDFIRYIWQYPSVTRPFVLDAIQEHGRDKTLRFLGSVREMEQLVQELQKTKN